MKKIIGRFIEAEWNFRYNKEMKLINAGRLAGAGTETQLTAQRRKNDPHLKKRGEKTMTYIEKKRWPFLGLPFTFTKFFSI